MKWLIEKELWEQEKRILKALSKIGHSVEMVEYLPFLRSEENIPEQTEEVVFYGSLGFANKLRKRKDIQRGVFCNLDRFECSQYYPHFGGLLLNQDYVLLPFRDVLRRKEFLFNSFGQDDCIFVRPNSGFKEFTGQVVPRETFTEDFQYLGKFGASDNTLVLISSPKKVYREYRFIVCESEVITGSMYMENGEFGEKYNDRMEPRHWIFGEAQRIVDSVDYVPEEMWSLDLCTTSESETNVKVLEIGSFSSSGLYNCDVIKIAKSVEDLLNRV